MEKVSIQELNWGDLLVKADKVQHYKLHSHLGVIAHTTTTILNNYIKLEEYRKHNNYLSQLKSKSHPRKIHGIYKVLS